MNRLYYEYTSKSGNKMRVDTFDQVQALIADQGGEYVAKYEKVEQPFVFKRKKYIRPKVKALALR